MRRAAKIFFIFVFIVFLLVGGVVFLGIRALRSTPEIKDDSVLDVRIEGEILDGPLQNPLRSLLGGAARNNLFDIRRAIDAAAGDGRIRAVVLRVGLNDVGWAGAEEIRAAVQRVRKANKPVYGLMTSDVVDDKNYYLATPASEITVTPESGMMINGLYAEAMFFRGALDKLYIKPDYIQFKEYKSAAEPFTRKDMSPQYRESLEHVVRDIEDRFVQAVAETRHKSPEDVRAAMDAGLQTAVEAKQQGWIDTLGYWTDLEKRLEAGRGSADEENRARLVSYSDYLQDLDAQAGGNPSIGVIFASGEIIAGQSDPWNQIIGSETMASYLRSLRKDRSIRAIILRVNSPGGSAVGSDVIWREVKEARAAGKPVVVSMGDVAASGGYYISMGADSIFSQPSTITGSIGVVFGKMNLRGFFEWLGVTFDAVQTTRSANLFSFVDSLTPEQEERVRAWMGQVYNDFVTKAAEGRKRQFEALEPMAHGRIWSGKQAQDRQLVDQLGGFVDAAAQARKLAGIAADEKVRFVIYPKRKGLIETLMSGDIPLLRDSSFSLQEAAARLSGIQTAFFHALQEPNLWMITPEVKIR